MTHPNKYIASGIGIILWVLSASVSAIEMGQLSPVDEEGVSQQNPSKHYEIDSSSQVESIDQGFAVIASGHLPRAARRSNEGGMDSSTIDGEPEYKLAVDSETGQQVVATREVQVSYVPDSLSDAEIEDIAIQYGFEAIRNFPHLGIFFGKVPSFNDLSDTMEALQSDQRFDKVELQVVKHKYTPR